MLSGLLCGSLYESARSSPSYCVEIDFNWKQIALNGSGHVQLAMRVPAAWRVVPSGAPCRTATATLLSSAEETENKSSEAVVGPSDEKVQWRNWLGCVMEPLTAVMLRGAASDGREVALGRVQLSFHV